MTGEGGAMRVLWLTGALVGLVLLAGCGDDAEGENETPTAEQLEQARKEGAREARQRDRLQNLQKRLKRLERTNRSGSNVVVDESGESTGDTAPEVLRSFHTPNVSCEVRTDGAVCSVVSIGLTFAVEGSGAAYTESGVRVASGAGPEAAWDSTVEAGSITCTIPAEDEPRGISCVNSATGHGFEASRVPDRQRAY